MWKILVAFIVFAAVSLAVLYKNADKIDMQGESHNVAPESASASAEASAPK